MKLADAKKTVACVPTDNSPWCGNLTLSRRAGTFPLQSGEGEKCSEQFFD